MLWIDKHQPRHLNELTCHPSLTNLLNQIVQGENVPHMLFYGSSGAGKKTRIMAVLRAIFGEAIDKVSHSSFLWNDVVVREQSNSYCMIKLFRFK